VTNRRLCFSVLLLSGVLASACSTPSPAPIAAPTIAPSSPTSEPPTALPATHASSPMPTLPPADATITFEGNECIYDGPDPIPAAESMTVNWIVNSTEHAWYGVMPIIVGEGKTKEDLAQLMRSDDPPPSWVTQAGTNESWGEDKQITVKPASGGLRSDLYFTCSYGESYDTSKFFAALGPFKVK